MKESSDLDHDLCATVGITMKCSGGVVFLLMTEKFSNDASINNKLWPKCPTQALKQSYVIRPKIALGTLNFSKTT